MKNHLWLGWVVAGLALMSLEAKAAAGGAQPIGVTPIRGQVNPKVVTAGIEYHDGPVMGGAHNVYFIWYGNWSGNTATTILPQFIAGLSGSNYFNTNGSYFDNSKRVPNSVVMAGQIFDSYSKGSSLSKDDVRAVVARGLSNGLPTDANGIYFVLTSSDVDQYDQILGLPPFQIRTGFGTSYCGYHTFRSMNDVNIKYAFVGSPERFFSTCGTQLISPNYNPGADSMASIIAHELSETVTDPELNAWYSPDLSGENGDKCAWNFGSTFATSNGSSANVTLGGRNYLIQQNWVNAVHPIFRWPGYCTLSFQTQPLCYQPYVQNRGWQPEICTGDVAGTVGQSLSLQAIRITAAGRSICYQAHVQGIGWQGEVCDGAVAGTAGLRLEALRIRVQSGGGHAEYFGQVQDIGWMGPALDGAMIGTTGQSRRLESVVIRIVP